MNNDSLHALKFFLEISTSNIVSLFQAVTVSNQSNLRITNNKYILFSFISNFEIYCPCFYWIYMYTYINTHIHLYIHTHWYTYVFLKLLLGKKRSPLYLMQVLMNWNIICSLKCGKHWTTSVWDWKFPEAWI